MNPPVYSTLPYRVWRVIEPLDFIEKGDDNQLKLVCWIWNTQPISFNCLGVIIPEESSTSINKSFREVLCIDLHGQEVLQLFTYTCVVQQCINPFHAVGLTKLGTFNKPLKGRQIGELLDSQIVSIRRIYSTGLYSQNVLSDTFQIKRVLIGKIIRGERAKHLPLFNKEPTKIHKMKLSLHQITEIQLLHTNKTLTQSDIARKFKVNLSTIASIIKTNIPPSPHIQTIL